MPIYTTPARQGIITKTPPIKGEPIKFCCDTAGALTAWSMLGNGQQTGTPSPQNIIMPEFVGVRTGNLNSAVTVAYGTQRNAYYADISIDADKMTTLISEINAISGDKYLNFSVSNAAFTPNLYISFSGGTPARDLRNPPFKINAGETVSTLIFRGRSDSADYTGVTITASEFMLNTGSTALPYEPYGYKIPITCAGQTVPVYLGQTQTVRRIKKLVLTGEESYLKQGSTSTLTLYSTFVAKNAASRNNVICSHLPFSYSYSTETSICFYSDLRNLFLNFGLDIMNAQTSGNTVAGLKEYLAAQYAAGTPVTVWYVLAEPQTTIVNEPLAKIGDYADELHSTDAAVTIPTAKGANVLTVDTELPPSSVSITIPDMYPSINKIPITGTNKEVKHILDQSGNFVYRSPQYYTWEGIRKIVRAGLAPQYYPLGSIIYDNFNPSTGTAFQVVAYDNHFDPTLTAQGYTHSMTLCELLLDDVITMDAAEAFLYTNQALPAGTYKFTIPNYDASYGGNKTYYFTSTAELPANSQIVMSWPYTQTPKTVTGYAPTASLTAMENPTAATGWNALTLTEWVDGTSPAATDLGTIAGPTNQAGTSSYGSMNHIHRARYGSNNYLQSGARQYLNSDKAANAWWKPQTIFDRPYGSSNIAGKLTKLSPSFVDVLAIPTIQSRTNQYFETTSLDGTTFTLSTNYNIQTDRLFLLSPMEIGFSTTDTTVGTLMGYYQGATDAKRIKYKKSNGNAHYWWLRTPYPSYCNHFRTVSAAGALYHYSAYSRLGLPAAACIQ